MINIPEEARQDFYTGRNIKQIGIDVEGLDYPEAERNYFVSDGSDYMWRSFQRDGSTQDYLVFYSNERENPREMELIHLQNRYHIMSFEAYFENMPSNAAELRIEATFYEGGVLQSAGAYIYGGTDQLKASSRQNPVRVYTNFIETRERHFLYFKAELKDANYNDLNFKMYYRKIAMTAADMNKEAAEQHYPFHACSYIDGKLQMAAEHIDNNNILSEKFSLTESLSSGDDLIFGSCEASVFNVGIVDHKGVLKDRTIRPYFKLETDPETYKIDKINWYQSETAGKRPEKYQRLTGTTTYRKVLEYLGDSIGEYRKYGEYITVGTTIKLRKFRQKEAGKKAVKYFRFEVLFKYGEDLYWRWAKDYTNLEKYIDENNPVPFKANHTIKMDEHTPQLWSLRVQPLDENKQDIDGTVEYDIEFGENVVYISETAEPVKSPAEMVWFYGKTQSEIETAMNMVSKLPLGKFKVQGAQRSQVHTLIKKDVTAFDALANLEDNAAAWYTFYLYGMNTYEYESNYGFEYARQIYSTYFNLAKRFGIEKVNYENEELLQEHKNTMPEARGVCYRYGKEEGFYDFLHYGEFVVNDPDSDYLYRVEQRLLNDESEKTLLDRDFLNYKANADEYGRGLMTHGSILVKETLADGTFNKYLVDAGDYFKISNDCTSLSVYYPFKVNGTANYGAAGAAITKEASLFRLYKPFKLTNASTRLVYYRYLRPQGSEDIFEADTSVTARDGLRSVLEPTGAFFHIDRYGEPQFIYCTKSGLYPSDTLYPEDILYPRKGTDGDLLSLSKYITFVADDYEVQDIGRIQILKRTTTNESKPAVQWEHIGDPDKENTYIINNNLFYCNEAMEYDFDSMPEVSQMLENLYHEISNIGYTPNTTVTHGMPWMEVGDRVGLLTEDGGVESFIFRRTINGIQKMRDTFESRGSECTKPIDNYAYKLY